MKHLKFTACAIGTVLAVLVADLQAQQVPIPTTAAECSGPHIRTDDTGVCADGGTHGLRLGAASIGITPARRPVSGTIVSSVRWSYT